MAYGLDLGRSGMGACQQSGRIARYHVRQHEGEQGHPKEHGHQQEQPAPDQAEQRDLSYFESA
jgi:hypothetical protein